MNTDQGRRISVIDLVEGRKLTRPEWARDEWIFVNEIRPEENRFFALTERANRIDFPLALRFIPYTGSDQ